MRSLCCCACPKRFGNATRDDQKLTAPEGDSDDFESIERFKIFWEGKLHEFLDKIKHKNKNEEKHLSVFRVILELYAHKDIISELYDIYDYSALEFEFYIPQLCTFLLHGNYEKSPKLECFLLDKCGQSLQFAHRLHWFLNAFCVNGAAYSSEGLSATVPKVAENASLQSAIAMRGGIPAIMMNQWFALGEDHVSPPGAPRNLETKAQEEKKDGSSVSVVYEEPSFATEAEQSTMRSKALDIAGRQTGCAQQIAQYQCTLNFVKELTDLADALIPVPIDRRTEVLREGLKQIEEKFCPSNVLYVPIGNTCHRIKRIHVEESFAFSTKERAPYLVCIEVVDYAVKTSSNPKKIRRVSRRNRASSHKGYSYTMKLPFNRSLTLALEDTEVDDANQCTRALTSLTPSPRESATPCQLPGDDDSDTKKFLMKSFNKSLSVRLTECGEASPFPSPVAGPSDSDNEEMGQWSYGRRRSKRKDPRKGGKRTKRVINTPIQERHQESPRARSESEDWYGEDEKDDDTDTEAPEKTIDKTKAVKFEEKLPATPKKTAQQRSVELTAMGPVDPSVDAPSRSSPRVALQSESEFELDDTEMYASDIADVTEDEKEQTNKPIIVFRERWLEKEDRIRQTSPHGNLKGWRLVPVIVKSNDDLRQEQFAAQLIAQFGMIFEESGLPLPLRAYDVIAVSGDSGLIEAVPDTVSLDSLKKNDPEYTSLRDFYIRYFGDEDSARFKRARRNFVESLAAYSIVCYLLQIKDRHNGNILIDAEGHVIHIDFGFILTNSPGKNFNFEQAPCKLTDEFVELMDGPRSSTFRRFRALCVRAYLAARKQREKIILLVEMMLAGNDHLPCFSGGKRATIEGLRSRFNPELRTRACQEYVHNVIIDQSLNNWRTRWYDKYQRCCVGIL